MEHPVVITQLDPKATEWIMREAERTGRSIEAIAAQLIYRGLEAENAQLDDTLHHAILTLSPEPGAMRRLTSFAKPLQTWGELKALL